MMPIKIHNGNLTVQNKTQDTMTTMTYLVTLEEPPTCIHDEGKILDGHYLSDPLH